VPGSLTSTAMAAETTSVRMTFSHTGIVSVNASHIWLLLPWSVDTRAALHRNEFEAADVNRIGVAMPG
jgi:hypothetical protein